MSTSPSLALVFGQFHLLPIKCATYELKFNVEDLLVRKTLVRHIQVKVYVGIILQYKKCFSVCMHECLCKSMSTWDREVHFPHICVFTYKKVKERNFCIKIAMQTLESIVWRIELLLINRHKCVHKIILHSVNCVLIHKTQYYSTYTTKISQALLPESMEADEMAFQVAWENLFSSACKVMQCGKYLAIQQNIF
ncbi:hypothetical protein EGR_09301 [Echinococcus granulosus]|uniref:Uncharacterized protein n=1 Tax=Echinococcus granulosus TaxID=6210 RepID=W6UBL0_ECHGR|nr:hypothetical protein EGR_09301 [Echinococcus granulosus]EUB55827.1 hypothetical protein EGR_09301 [Echinococcus granulosus]